MNRREFTQRLSALAVLPAMPVKLAAAAPAKVASVTYGLDPYVLAKYTARVNNHLSPDLLRTALGFSRADSKSVITRLIQEKVIVAPDAMGVSKISEGFLNSLSRNKTAAHATDTLQKTAEEKLNQATKSLAEDGLANVPANNDQQEDTLSIAVNSPQV